MKTCGSITINIVITNLEINEYPGHRSSSRR